MDISSAVNGFWAITPESMADIHAVFDRHISGEVTDLAGIEAALGRPLANNTRPLMNVNQGVAIIDVQGVIAQKMNLMNDISGGTSSQLVSAAFLQAMDDTNVKGIILYTDSPGGTVAGASELAETIYQARGKKPVVAFTDGMIASAAYWITSACDSIFISGDTNPIGSIGVVSGHRDYSGAEAKAGIKTTEITAGSFKRVTSQYEPLSDAGRAEILAKVEYLYNGFVGTVARNRGVSKSRVLSSMADGRIFLGKQAINNGLVDGISTMSKIMADMQTPETRNKLMKGRRPSAHAHAVMVQPAISNAAFNTVLSLKGIQTPASVPDQSIAVAAERKKAVESIAAGGSNEHAIAR